MQNKAFFKIISIFVTILFVAEMIPFQALAIDRGGALKTIYDNATCKWGMNPPGMQSQPGSQKIYLPMKEFFENVNGEMHDLLVVKIYASANILQEDGVTLDKTNNLNFKNGSTENYQVQVHTETPASVDFYKLKSGNYYGYPSKNAYNQLSSSCGKNYENYKWWCFQLTVEDPVASYCQNNPNDCDKITKANPVDFYQLKSGGSYHHYPNWNAYNQLSKSCGYDLSASYCSQPTLNEQVVNYCQNNPNDCIKTTKTFYDVLGYTLFYDQNPIFYYSSKLTGLPTATITTCQPIWEKFIDAQNKKDNTLIDQYRNKLINNGCGFQSTVTREPALKVRYEQPIDIKMCEWVTGGGWWSHWDCSKIGSEWQLLPKGTQIKYPDKTITTGNSYLNFAEPLVYYKTLGAAKVSPLQSYPAETKTVSVATLDEFVKSFTWSVSGSDHAWSGLHSKSVAWALFKGNYLTANGTTVDGKYWFSEEKTGMSLLVGLIIGTILNILLPGAGLTIGGTPMYTISYGVAGGAMTTVTAGAIVGGFTLGWGDIIGTGLMAASFLGGGATAQVGDITLTGCSAAELPPELPVSRPSIQIEDFNADIEPYQIVLHIVPDSTKTGKVTGYKLYRDDKTDPIQVKENLTPEQAQSSFTYTDTDNIQLHKTYAYTVEPIVSEGVREIAMASIYTKALPSCSFNAKPSTIFKGGKATLNWSCERADSAKVQDLSSGSTLSTQINGSVQVQPQKTTTYILTATNSDGSKPFPPVQVKVYTGGIHEINP